MDEIRVISGNKDGVDRRREKAKSRRYLVCDGTADNDEINEALASGASHFLGLGDVWERIFGGKD